MIKVALESIDYLGALRCISISLSSCSTHFLAKTTSVNLLLEARARFRISKVASSDIESALAKLAAYSASVLAWKPAVQSVRSASRVLGSGSTYR